GFEQTDARILIAIPAWELLREARALLRHQIVWAAGLVLAVVMLGWVLGVRLGRSIRQLAGWVEGLADFRGSATPPMRSYVREVNGLQLAPSHMLRALAHYQAITSCLSHEMQLERMLPVVLEHLVKAVDGEGGVVYLCDEENDLLELAAVYGGERYRRRFTLSEFLPGEVYAALDAVRERYPGF